MLNTGFKSSWLTGGWVAAVALVVAASLAMGANLSTTAFIVALAITPGIVVAVLARSAPAQTVAQILHSVETKDGRS